MYIIIFTKQVELKNGDNIKGDLENIDNYMNLKINDAIYSSKTNDKFWKISEIYIRGNNINSIILKDGLLEKIEEQSELASLQTNIPRNFYRKYFYDFNFFRNNSSNSCKYRKLFW